MLANLTVRVGRLCRATICFSVMVVVVASASGQARITGSFQSSAFVSEHQDGDRHGDFYEGLRFRIAPTGYPNLHLSSYARVAHRSGSDWEDRLYSAYLAWHSTQGKVGLRVGRQFLYHGVINGTADGVLLTVAPDPRLSVRFVAGVEAPHNRATKLQKWNDGNVLGGQSSLSIAREAKLNVSYFQRARDEETVWQQLGGTLSGALTDRLHYLARLDFNLLEDEYQAMRYRLTYLSDRFSLSGEVSSQKPRVYEDSFFNIFRLVAYNQVRTLAEYPIGAHSISVQYLYTWYEEGDDTNEVIGTLSGKWGSVGVVNQTGFGGKNIGVYGDLRWAVVPNLTLNARSSYYNYERHSVDFHEEATSLSAGARYRPLPQLELQAEVQESRNPHYENNVRGLFRLTYRFDSRSL